MSGRVGTGTSKKEMMRYCAVLGCRSSAMELRTWRKGACDLHRGKTREKCGCEEPFVLHPFPPSSKFRSKWLHCIGLPELEVSDATRVCSLHFVEGKPTSRSYFPTLYLQGDLSDGDEAEVNEEYEGEDEILRPQIDSTYSCGEDPLRENSNIHSSTRKSTNNFLSEDDSGSLIVSHEFMRDSENLSSEDAPEMIIPEAADFNDDVILVEEKESAANTDDDVQVMYEKPKMVPLASYDPQAQVLQISNPVKYISECHTRIAQLLAEKEEMKTAYEKEIERLKYLNTSLRRRFLNSHKLFINSTAKSSGTRRVRKKKFKILSHVK